MTEPYPSAEGLVVGDVRPELAIQALLLAVEAMRAQIQALAVRVTMVEERFDDLRKSKDFT